MFSPSHLRRIIRLTAVVCTLVWGVNAQQSGAIRGTIVDPNGAVVQGAVIVVTSSAGTDRKVTSNQDGGFVVAGLGPGTYLVRVSAPGFATLTRNDVTVVVGKTIPLQISLSVGSLDTAQVTVGDPQSINIDPDANASATVLKGADLDALPDDPAELEAALQAMAGPGAGPGGGEIFIDGFSGGSMPRRETIREVRINQNPFSSEYDRLGLGRIEIFTKPGTEEFSGEVDFEFEDESFNSRNPFAANRPPFQMRNFRIDLSGPIVKKRASFYTDFEHETVDTNSLINAVVLDANLNTVPFQRAVLVPTKGVEFSPRFDISLRENHTLVARYAYNRSRVTNSGLGGFDLLSRTFSSRASEHLVRLNDTLVISPKAVNETRFQYIRRRASRQADDNSPTVRVLDAFTSGGANIGQAFNQEDRFELQNYTPYVLPKHSLKFGIRLRNSRITDSSAGNFAGTFTFTSIDQYRETIRNTPGAFPTRFTIAGGNPLARVSRTDAGLFLQEDWRFGAKLTLSFGLRYEDQTNISSHGNIAPRFGFAFAPGAGGKDPPKTVFRGGVGVFYERFSDGLTLQTRRFNGVNQQRFEVTDPAILDAVIFTQSGVSNVPSIGQLAAQPQTTRIVSPGLQSPYTVQTVLSVERQLPHKTTVSATFASARTHRLLRSRNINAPANGIRPNPAGGNIFAYESTARFDQRQLIVNFRSNFAEGVSVFGNYSIGKTKSDSDGAESLPANSYDLSGEYGNALLDVRHRFTLGSNIETFWGLRLNPFISFRSGVPFNITTGEDDNDDLTFNDRPAFAASPTEPGIIINRFGAFDPTPEAGDIIIPRNYGRGPQFFLVNLGIAKEFGFGKRSGGSGGDDDDDESRYNIEFSVRVRNLFNRTNGGIPVGNLSSAFFGRSVALAGGSGSGGGGSQTAGNRRIGFEIEFSF